MNSKMVLFSFLVVALVIFLIVVNQKKKLKEEETYSDEKWNKMIDMWVDYELDHPIKDVLTYDAEVNNGGHLQFFENCNSELEEMMISLKKTLPTDIYDNLKEAYDVYTSSNINIENVIDYVDTASDNLFFKYDTYYYNNDSKVTEVLKEYASTIKIDD